MNYKTIYGEKIEGKMIRILENTVIVETTDGNRYLVHKKNTPLYYTHAFQFDLRRCQKIGKQLLPEKGVKDITIW